MENFTNYLQEIKQPEQRKRVEEVLSWVDSTFATLKTEIKWNQPMFIDHGTFIIAFSLAKKHLSVAPEQVTISRFSKQIEQAGYSQTKELFRIGWDQKVDYELLEEIIKFNIDDKAEITTFWRS